MIEKISIIGAGNVAWHLAPALEAGGATIMEVFSREAKTAKKLTRRLYDARVQTHLDFSRSQAKLFIIALPDDIIQKAVGEIQLPKDAILVHVSGSQPLSIFEDIEFPTGIFYPLQTFSKEKKVVFSNIPILIEATDKKTMDALADLAFTLSEKVYHFTSEERKVLHLAAVVACNFTNHLFSISKNIMDKKGLEFDFLKPLVEETVEKAFKNKPEKSQTGPAIRRDESTIEKHLEVLKKKPAFHQLYRFMTRSIQDFHKKK